MLVPILTVFTLFNLAIQTNFHTTRDTTYQYQNSSIALSYPSEEIRIDGDISDWDHIEQAYNIENRPYNDPKPDPEDFSSFFKTAYNPATSTLFILVAIKDNSVVTDLSESASWLSQDTYSLYINPENNSNGSGIYSYTFNDEYMEYSDTELSWDPAVVEGRHQPVMDKAFFTDHNYRYFEVSLKMVNPLNAGNILGLGHQLADVDEGESGNTVMAWTKWTAKSTTFGNIGTLLLADNETQISMVEGEIIFHSDSSGHVPARLIVERKGDPESWIQIQVNDDGTFQVPLPTGNYEFKLRNAFTNLDDERVKLVLNSTALEVKDAKDAFVSMDIIAEPLHAEIPDMGLLRDGFQKQDEKALDDFVELYMSYYGIPGVSVAIIDSGRITYAKGYGVENFYTKKPVHTRTLMEGASITKAMFAIAVMRLAERGEIDLDKPLYEYVSPQADVADDPRAKRITARHILSHSSGLPNWPWMNPDGKADIAFEPGERYRYSGMGFEYLQQVTEKITGKDITEILHEEVNTVFGLENSYYKYEAGLREKASVGHYGRRPRVNDIRRETSTASSVMTDASDYARFLMGIHNRIGLNEKSYHELFKKHTLTRSGEAESGNEYYFGLGVYFEKSEAGLSFGHSGNNGDFKCDAMFYDDLESGYVLLTNNDHGDRLIYAFQDMLIRGSGK